MQFLRSKRLEMFLFYGANLAEEIGIFVLFILIKLTRVGGAFGDNLNWRCQLSCHKLVPIKTLRCKQIRQM